MTLLRFSSLLLVFAALEGAPAALAQATDEPGRPAAEEYWMGVPVARDDDEPPTALSLAKFKEAVAKVEVEGFYRMPEMSEGGDHQLILVRPPERAYYVVAERLGFGAKFEKSAAGKLSRFSHNGHEAFFAQLKDEEGEAMSFLFVKYPEHRMGLFISAKPVARRAELMKLLAQVEL